MISKRRMWFSDFVIFLQGFGSWSFLQPLWLCFSRILCLLEWKETFDLGILEVPAEAIDDAAGKSILGNDSKMISNRNLMISWDHSRTGICDGIETWWSIIWSNRLIISYHIIQDCLSSFLLYTTSSLYPFPWTVEGNTRPVAHQRLHSPCTQCLCQCFGSDLYHQVPSSWRGQKVEWLAFSGRIHQDDYVFAWYVAKEKHFEHSTFFERCFEQQS